MSKEKILIPSDSIEGPTGFAVNSSTIAWSLAKDYDVHVLGLQSVNNHLVHLNMNGEKRTVTEHPNYPIANQKWDFGTKSFPRLLKELEPSLVITVNDIQMISHIPSSMYPSAVNMQLIDMPSRKLISEDALFMELQGHIQRFKELYQDKTKWILLGPQDGEPPMPEWGSIYHSADKIVAMSDYGKDIYKKYYDIDATRIYHAVDTSLFKPGKQTMFDGKFVVGNINRNQPRKQPLRTMKAFAKFAKNKNDVLLHMQMDWNDIFGWPIEYFARLFGIGNKMVIPGHVGMPREEIVKVYQQWSINANSTAGEGFGLSTIEGAASGLPNILTDYTTSKELVLGGEPSPRGILVPYVDLYWEKIDVAAVQRALIDENKMAQAFQFYYDNPEIRIQHGKNAREWVEKNCNLKVIESQWLNVVKETLSN